MKLFKSNKRKHINNISVARPMDFLRILEFNRKNEVMIDNGIINNDKLPSDYQKYFDERLVTIGTETLVGTNDLMMKGLVSQMPQDSNIYTYQKMDTTAPANIGMDFDVNRDRDALNFEEESVPVPVFSKNWRFGRRMSNMMGGRPVNIQEAYFDDAIKKVSLAIEETLFNGLETSVIKINGKGVNGYTDHPQRITATTPTNWLLEANHPKIKKEVLELLKELLKVRPNIANNNVYLYYSSDLLPVMDSRINQYSGMTIKEELERSSMIGVVKMSSVLDEKNRSFGRPLIRICCLCRLSIAFKYPMDKRLGRRIYGL